MATNRQRPLLLYPYPGKPSVTGNSRLTNSYQGACANMADRKGTKKTLVWSTWCQRLTKFCLQRGSCFSQRTLPHRLPTQLSGRVRTYLQVEHALLALATRQDEMIVIAVASSRTWRHIADFHKLPWSDKMIRMRAMMRVTIRIAAIALFCDSAATEQPHVTFESECRDNHGNGP